MDRCGGLCFSPLSPSPASLLLGGRQGVSFCLCLSLKPHQLCGFARRGPNLSPVLLGLPRLLKSPCVQKCITFSEDCSFPHKLPSGNAPIIPASTVIRCPEDSPRLPWPPSPPAALAPRGRPLLSLCPRRPLAGPLCTPSPSAPGSFRGQIMCYVPPSSSSVTPE